MIDRIIQLPAQTTIEVSVNDFTTQSSAYQRESGRQFLVGAVVQLSLTMRFAHFAALMQVAAHVYRSPRLQCESAILPSHHTDFISHPGTACIREDAGCPLPSHGSDNITTGHAFAEQASVVRTYPAATR